MKQLTMEQQICQAIANPLTPSRYLPNGMDEGQRAHQKTEQISKVVSTVFWLEKVFGVAKKQFARNTKRERQRA